MARFMVYVSLLMLMAGAYACVLAIGAIGGR